MRYILSIISLLFLVGCSANNHSDISGSGIIEGIDVTISSEVGGRIKETRVRKGSSVTRGDTLIIIDDDEYRILLREAIANEEGAHAQYMLALKGAREEDIVKAEVALKNAEEDYNRMKELLSLHTVARKQYDDAYAKYITAKQNFEKISSGLRTEEITIARAKRDQARARVDRVRKKIQQCTIVAPIDGIVTLKSVKEGELVVAGSNLLRITYLEKVELTIYVSEIDLGRIHLGQKAVVSIDSYVDKSFEGIVVYLSPIAEFTPKNVQTKEERTKLVFGVEIQVDNPEGILKPGMPADATFHTETQSDT